MKEIALFEKLSNEKQKHIEVLLLPEYKGVWITAIEKYPGEAHFINELLQNADDANASKVSFVLSEDGLVFKHNGNVRFTVSDIATADEDRQNGKYGHINSITGLGDSQKLREQKIGKFGIGFKAVFAYTANPEIYDDFFSFRLDNFIVPVSIPDNRDDRNKGETLFYFPFNHATKAKTVAYEEVEKKLKSLQNSIIFLNNIREISWKSKQESGSFKKLLHTSENMMQHNDLLSQVYHVSSVVGNKRIPETFRIFSKNITTDENDFSHKISIGFKIKNDDSFDTAGSYGAFCFFPTQEITNQKFLIHAPFLLTDNRQNLLPNQEWNKLLIKELVQLTQESFKVFRNEDLSGNNSILAKNFLNFLPYNENAFFDQNTSNPIQFYPFYKGFLELLQTEQILPGRNNTFYNKEKAYWAADPDLADLFSDQQLSQLLAVDNAGFVFTDLGHKNAEYTNRPLANYLKNSVKEIIDPAKLIRLITKEFTENQTIEWLLKFYEYLNDKPSYLAISKDYHVVLCDDNTAEKPYNKRKLHYNVFLPTTTTTDFKTVHPQLFSSEIGKTFFSNLGLSQPDIKAVFLNTVLKNYDKDEVSIDDEDLINHTRTLIDFFKSQDTSEFEQYIERISHLHLFRGRSNKVEDEVYLYRSIDLYKPTSDLLLYFEGFESAVFFDEGFYEAHFSKEELAKLHSILDILKVKNHPDIETVEDYPNRGLLDYFQLSAHKDNRTNILYDKEIQGLELFQEKISFESSLAGWQVLKELIRQNSDEAHHAFGLLGILEYKPQNKRKFFYTSFESSALRSLRTTPWLYDKENKLVIPQEIAIDQLHNDYDISSSLAQNLISVLQFKISFDDPELSDDQQEIYDLGKKIASLGLSEEEVMAALEELQKNKNQKPVISPVQEDLFPDDENEDDIPEVTEKKKKVKNTIKKIAESLFDKISENFDEEKEISTQISKKEDEEDFEENVNYVPPINLEEEYQKRIEEVQRELEEIQLMEQLKNDIVAHEKYTFGWFKALMELEYRDSVELNNSGKDISISFGSAQMENDDSRMLILSKPVRPIPHSIEEHGDLLINLFIGNEIKQVSVEVVNVKEYTVRAKIRRVSEVINIDFSKVTKAVIDIKNPIFLLEKLRSNLIGLDFELEDNLKEQLPENIEFIFGPPGTGKTTYLADQVIIPEMKKNQDLKILVLTPTNKAADVLSAKIMEKMKPDNSYLEWLIRFGLSGDAKVAEELSEDFKKIDIDNYNKATVISTIARFSYDFFLPEGSFQKNYLSEIPWDFVIIDEASMITLPNIVNVIYRQTQAKIIIAGDPFQISPISRVPEWQDENIYTMVNLNSFKEPQTEPHNFSIVKRETQYRSIPSVGRIFSVFTYDDLLQHHRTHEEQKVLKIDNVDFKALNVIKFPVAKFESIFKPNSLEGSKYHIYSALFTVELVLHIAKERMAKQEEFFKIGIICPYRAQSDIIERIISQEFTNNEFVEISVGTIHGFQGDECDAIFTIFNPPNYIKGNPDMFLNKHNILNVAISRARDYLFVLMPDDKTENVKKLQKINQIADLCFVYGGQNFAQFSSITIENKLFGSPSYIYDNSFATTHQKVNVYSKPIKKYELRCEEKAVDVQIQRD